jgi:tetratricopeptide (TPR) repeat protein
MMELAMKVRGGAPKRAVARWRDVVVGLGFLLTGLAAGTPAALAQKQGEAVPAVVMECLKGTEPVVIIAKCTEGLGVATRQGLIHKMHEKRGSAYLGTNKFQDAVSDFNAALKIAPDAGIDFKKRGIAYMGLRNFEKSRADLTMALKLLPDDPEVAQRISQLDQKVATAQGQESETGKFLDSLKIPVDPKKPVAADDPRKTDPQGTSIFDSLVVKRPPKAGEPEQPTKAPDAPPVAITQQTRVALVIGNGAYQHVPQLTNPASDSALIAKTLRETGFSQVDEVHDMTREGLLAAIRAFEQKTQNADWSVIYFAGHGIEVAGQNYIIPVDATLKSERDVQDETISLNRLMAALEGTRGLKLVVLDACRDNPFANQMKRSDGTRSASRGLARVEPAGGILVSYASKGGEVAEDGAGANSPFALALARRLREPNLEINKVFRLVRDDVLVATHRRQEPFTYGALGGEDYIPNPRP